MSLPRILFKFALLFLVYIVLTTAADTWANHSSQLGSAIAVNQLNDNTSATAMRSAGQIRTLPDAIAYGLSGTVAFLLFGYSPLRKALKNQ